MIISPRLGLNLPDDISPNDDTVDVTTQISQNFLALESGVGMLHCTSITRPTTGNFPGRLIMQTDDGTIRRWDGAAWQFVADTNAQTFTPYIRQGNATTGTIIPTSSSTGRLLRVGYSYFMEIQAATVAGTNFANGPIFLDITTDTAAKGYGTFQWPGTGGVGRVYPGALGWCGIWFPGPQMYASTGTNSIVLPYSYPNTIQGGAVAANLWDFRCSVVNGMWSP